MSYLRAKLRANDRNTYLDNRLATFTTPPVQTGDLYVWRNLDVSGNVTIRKDLNAVNFYATGNYYLDTHLLIPYGTIIQSAAVNTPGGWMLCNGASLLVVEYPDLFGAIDYTYGGEEGEFNIPDLRGRTVIGAGTGSGGLTNRVLGVKGGTETHTLTTSEIPSHSHTLTRRSNEDNGAFDTGNAHQDESSAATTDRADLGPFSTNNTGGGSAHNNMQPYIVLNYFIKY